jgi:sugar porter (SP) family MFS transporter
VLSGYDQGVIAAAMLTMKPALGLTSVEQELSIGALNVTAALGGLLAGYAAERHGRKAAIALANVFFVAGSLAIALAPDFGLLLAGRILQGVGVGFALVVAPILTAELVPASARGMLVSLSDVSTNLGILLGYSAGLLFLDTPDGWRYMFGVGALPAVALLVLIWAVPESPRWLVSVNRHATALRALNELYGDPLAADKHLAEMAEAASVAAAESGAGSWRQVLRHPDRVQRAMIWRGLAVAFFSQAIGTEAVVYYSPEIVRAAGVASDRAVLLAIMGVGLCKLGFLLVASQLFDRLGRRPMLLASAAGLGAALLVMAASEARAPTSDARAALAIGGLCFYMAAFSIGFSPLTCVHSLVERPDLRV